MSLDTFLLYLAAWTLIALSPGPAVLFAMSQAARHGMRGAAVGTAGILLGHVVCFLLVAFGLAALLASVNGAMMAIRIAGALYLMYLGVRMILAKPRETADVPLAAGRKAHGGIAILDPVPFEVQTDGIALSVVAPTVGGGIGLKYMTLLTDFTIGFEATFNYMIGPNVPALNIAPLVVRYTF